MVVEIFEYLFSKAFVSLLLLAAKCVAEMPWLSTVQPVRLAYELTYSPFCVMLSPKKETFFPFQCDSRTGAT